MANCPKCNHHLSVTDWKQKCPYCGANIVLYDLQERLMQDADKAEVQNYHFQKKIDRLKASFVGSKLAITRIVTSLLPILAVLLPLVKGNFKAPFDVYSGGVSVFTIIKCVENIDTDGLLEILAGFASDRSALLLAIAAVCFVLSVLLIVIHVLFLMLACSPKGKVRNYTVDILMCVFSIAACISFALIPDCGFITGSGVGIGGIVYVLLVFVNFGIDIATFVQGIEVNHKQCYVGGIPIEEYFELVKKGTPQEELRAEMYRRLNEIYAQKMAELEEKKKAEAKEAAVNG